MPSENRAGPAWLVGEDDDQAAAQLPGRLASIFADLPAIIVVPDSGQDDEDPIYRPLSGARGATVGELRTAIAALNNSIEDERRKASALESLLTMVSGNPAEDDLTVSEALRRVASRGIADALDKVKGSLISAYKRSGKSDRTISKWMADETWFAADEAVAAGLADRVEQPVKIAASFDLSRFNYRHAPRPSPAAAWDRVINNKFLAAG